MFFYAFTFRSLTAAQNARRLLLAQSITAELRRAPKQLSQQGCGYLLHVSARQGMAAYDALVHAGMQPEQQYRCFSNGDCQKVQL